MTIEKLEHSQVKASFEVSAEEFTLALDESFKINNEKVTIKGFRKGKAPKKIYLENYGVESLYADAIDQAVSKKMREELLVDTTIQIASQPMLDLDYSKVKEGEGFAFTLTFDVYPEVKLGQYKGVEVNALSNVVTDEEIANEKSRLLASKITMVEKEDKTIASGDTANFDFVGSVDGVEFPGGKAENYELKIGSGQFIPGFEDQMIGMVCGTEKDIKVTFPENYGEKSLAGKEANFHLTLHSVKCEVSPELTDDLVKELNLKDVVDVAGFDKYVLETLTKRKENNNNRQIENEVLQKVCDAAEIDLPQGMINDRANSLKAQTEAQAKQYGIPFETFLSFSGVTVDQFNVQVHEEALRQVKFELVLDKIAEVEGLLPNDEEVTKALEDYAKSTKMSVKDVETRIGKAPFAAQLASNNAIKLILDNKVLK